MSDPVGNRILLHRRYAPYLRRLDALMRVERVDFVSFLTQDIARAKRFYSEVLGLESRPKARTTWSFAAAR